MNDEYYIQIVINLFREAAEKGADPFGAILVNNDKVVAKSIDQSVEKSDPTYHAELSLISEYCRGNKIFSLGGYTLYSSTEPCVMCSGEIKWANISRVVFSVPQELLQQYSGGKEKSTCESVVNTGHKKIEVIGLLLPKEGIKVFKDYPLDRKEERYRKLLGK